MDLTFQVPMQYCSLQHRTLLPSSVTSTPGHCFCFGSTSSFFLELFLHSSPVVYWAPTDLGVYLSVSYHFAFSYCSWGSQARNTEMVCHSLLQWTLGKHWQMFLAVVVLVTDCCSVTKLCVTLCNPMDCSMPGFSVLHYFPEFAQTHIHCISDAIQPPHPLSLPSPPTLSLS